jgi:type IV pilus assembly protein PilV
MIALHRTNTLHRSNTQAKSRARGFTLLEVMVALMITSIGLLGIAKIQALAYASTGSAGLRSLVALQAAGLAASMHANRNYWAAAQAPVPLTITGLTISDAGLDGNAISCIKAVGPACLPADLAAFDLHTYAQALNSTMPGANPLTTITCPITIPVSCTIQVTWSEHAVSVTKEGAASTTQTTVSNLGVVSAGTFAPTYTLYVEP